MRIILGALLALFVTLQYVLWLGDFGYLRLNQMRQSISEQERVNAELLSRNLRLQAEVVDLKEGQSALEERARSQLGLIKKDETFYQIIENDQ